MKYRNAIAAALAVAALAGCRNNVYVVVPTQDGKTKPTVVPPVQDKQNVKPAPKPPAPDNANPAPKPPAQKPPAPDNANPAPKPPAPKPPAADNANPALKPPAPKPPAPKPPAPAVQDRKRVKMPVRKPAVPAPRAVYAVAVSPAGAGAGSLAEAIGFDVRAGLAEKGRAVVSPGSTPGKGEKLVTLEISVRRRDVSTLGDFRICEGVARVRVNDGGKEIGLKEFRAEGKRADNKTDAERGVRDALSKQIVEWVGGLTVPKTK